MIDLGSLVAPKVTELGPLYFMKKLHNLIEPTYLRLLALAWKLRDAKAEVRY